MHFDKDFVESFESPFEFALYICMYYGAARMLEFIGQRVIHTFIYNKLKDLTAYRDVNKVGSFKCHYVQNMTNIAFDVDKEIAIMITCNGQPDYLKIMPIEIVQKSKTLNNIPVKIVHVNFVGKVCNQCGKSDVQLKACSKCKIVKYCSKKCQCADWKEHKKTCYS